MRRAACTVCTAYTEKTTANTGSSGEYQRLAQAAAAHEMRPRYMCGKGGHQSHKPWYDGVTVVAAET